MSSTENFRLLDVDKLDHSSVGGGGTIVLSRLRKNTKYEVTIQVTMTSRNSKK